MTILAALVFMLSIPTFVVMLFMVLFKKIKAKKLLIPVAMFFLSIVVIIILPTDSAEDDNKTAETSESKIETTSAVVETTEAETELQTTVAETTTQESTEATKSLDELLSQGKSDYEAGTYPYITVNDLDTYYPNLNGVSVCVVGVVSNVYSSEITVEGADVSQSNQFNVKVDYSDLIEEGDTVAIFGTVDDAFTLLGITLLDINDAEVIAVNDEAQNYKKDSTDESLKGYLKVTEDLVNKTGADSISKDEYIALCQDLSYSDILRNPDNYDKEYCYITGKVDQVIDGWFGYTIYIEDSYGNKWSCSYSYEDGESRMLEGDKVTVYGVCTGTVNAKTVLGKQVTMPDVDIEYYEIK